MGCDSEIHLYGSPRSVSIHAPTWGATSIGCSPLFTLQFQSTHPHGVRRAILSWVVDAYKVSIHAPTWGATAYDLTKHIIVDVSIHAPTWGATTFLLTYQSELMVSIHAPTWGATRRKHPMMIFQMFQSTHPHGVRLSVEVSIHNNTRFQSTHPHGVRLLAYRASAQPRCFNPRTHMGCDRIALKR